MRILMLSWEYPPHVVGGIARHVEELSEALVRQGEEVMVVTLGGGEAPPRENRHGVRVWRQPFVGPGGGDFLTTVLRANYAFLERAISLMVNLGPIDLIHAHDWLVAYAARTLKHAYRLPLVATIHATEWGRNNGLHNDLQRQISDVEWWLAFEAWRLIACSQYMAGELQRIFQVPPDKVEVIPNGVVPERFTAQVPSLESLRHWYASPHEQIIFFVGRLVHEKGVSVLLRAMPQVLAQVPTAKLIIAGRGPAEEALRAEATALGLGPKVYFAGFIDDQTRNGLYRLASAAVFPSLYEPFGIVALEAMAAGVPVVVSNTGGLGEIVGHGESGLKVPPGDPGALAWALVYLLQHPEIGARLRARARQQVETVYNWERIAGQTRALYRRVRTEYEASDWRFGVEDFDLDGALERIGELFDRQLRSRYQRT